MRISEVDFILIPEWLARPTPGEPDDDHWISRWQRNFSSASWLDSAGSVPVDGLLAQAKPTKSRRPIIVVTHGNAINVLLDAGAALSKTAIIGAFIVAPVPDADKKHAHPGAERAQLGFPSVLVAPDNHPELSVNEAQRLAGQIGSHFVAAGAAGRLDTATGQGPWPEGLLRLGWFLKQLTAH